MAMAGGVYCGVPSEGCLGILFPSNARVRGHVRKFHRSSKSAFSCKRKYLLSQGYREGYSRRELISPSGSVLLLTKESKYGARFRRGKEGTRLIQDCDRATM